MRKTKITKITVETHRRVVIQKRGGQAGGSTEAAGEKVERTARKNGGPMELPPPKENEPND